MGSNPTPGTKKEEEVNRMCYRTRDTLINMLIGVIIGTSLSWYLTTNYSDFLIKDSDILIGFGLIFAFVLFVASSIIYCLLRTISKTYQQDSLGSIFGSSFVNAACAFVLYIAGCAFGNIAALLPVLFSLIS